MRCCSKINLCLAHYCWLFRCLLFCFPYLLCSGRSKVQVGGCVVCPFDMIHPVYLGVSSPKLMSYVVYVHVILLIFVGLHAKDILGRILDSKERNWKSRLKEKSPNEALVHYS